MSNPTPVLSPVYLAWEIQKTCNLACRFCYSSSWNLVRAQRLQNENPSVDFISQKLALLRRAFPELTHINWTGGEPLLRHRDLGGIFRASKDLGFNNILSTNGYFSGPKIPGGSLNWQAFHTQLDEWSDDLDTLSISLDSADRYENNSRMRVLVDGNDLFHSHRPSAHFDDVQRILNAFKARSFPFALKVNTMVTGANHGNLHKMVDLLADVPCTWHLIEFNPRQCPEESIDEFLLKDTTFAEKVLTLDQDVEAAEKTCRFFITTRRYDGDNKAYPFLVINCAGEVLLPFGKEHFQTTRLTACSSAEDLRGLVTNGVLQKISLDQFNDGNRRVLSRYLHKSAAITHSTFSLQWLQEHVRDTLRCDAANVSVNYTGQFCLAPQSALSFANWLTETLNKYTPHATDLTKCTLATSLFLEQPRVGRFLASSYGIVGGTLTLLSRRGELRKAPCLDDPPGLHIPWCFSHPRLKDRFFRGMFKTIASDIDYKSTAFFVNRPLEDQMLAKALAQFTDSTKRSRIRTVVEEFIAGSEITYDEERYFAYLVLSRCVEGMLGKVGGAWHSGGSDPWIDYFFHNRKRTLMVTSGEAATKVSAWIQNQGADLHTIRARWSEAAKKAEQPRHESPAGLFEAFWLYLFDPVLEITGVVPDVFAFHAGEGGEHVAIGSVYLLPDFGVESLGDPERLKRRVGAFYDALAGPSLAEQLRKREQESRDARMKEQADAEIKRLIHDDLKALLDLQDSVSKLALQIQTVVDPTVAPFLVHRFELFPIPETTLFYGFDAASGMFSWGNSDKKQDGWQKVDTIHSLGNAGGNPPRTWSTAWSQYQDFLKCAGISTDRRNGKVVRGFGDASLRAWGAHQPETDIAAQDAFRLLKLIYHRPRNERSNVYDAQIMYALRIATLGRSVEFRAQLRDEDFNFGVKEDLPDLASWLGKCAGKKRVAGGAEVFLSDEAHCCLPVQNGVTALDCLSAIYQLAIELLGDKKEYVHLETVSIFLDDAGADISFHCDGVFPLDNIGEKELANAKNRGFRSTVKTLCKAVNQVDLLRTVPSGPQAASWFSAVNDANRAVFRLFLKRSATPQASSLPPKELPAE